MQLLHRRVAVPLLAAHDVALGELQVVENAVRVGPLAEQVIVLEEVVMAERRVGDDQRLHRGRVLLHDVADAGVGVDDDLVGEAAHAPAVTGFVLGEVLAERPMLVEQRHADRRIGVEHLLGGDDLDLVRVGVEAEFPGRDRLDRVVDALDGPEVPVGALEEEPLPGCDGGHGSTDLARSVLR